MVAIYIISGIWALVNILGFIQYYIEPYFTRIKFRPHACSLNTISCFKAYSISIINHIIFAPVAIVWYFAEIFKLNRDLL